MNEQAIDPCSADIDWGITNPPRTPRCLLLRGSEGNDATDVHQVAFLLASPIIPPSHISLKGNYYKLGPWGDILHSEP